jgi:hypothetical protein
MRTLATGVLLAAVLAAAAVGAPPKTRALVLRLSDLPAGFTVERTHVHASVADAADGGTPAAQLRRWGFLRSYLVQYTGKQAQMFTGPVTVVSAAALFRTPAGAHAANAASKSDANGLGVARVRVTTALGPDAWAYTYVDQQAPIPIRVYAVGWRRGQVQAYLAIEGNDGVVTRGRLFALAQKQDRYLPRPV